MSVQVKGSGTIGGLDEGLVVSGIVTSSTQINVGSNIKLGNAGVVTATSFVGSGANLTGIDLGAVTGATGDFSIADKIVHTGDTNTALRFPAADTFTVETSGSERFRIDSDGKLILGTEIVNAGNANAAISLFLSGTRSGAYGGETTNAIIFDNQTAAVDAGGSITLAGYSGTQAIAKALIRGGNEGSSSTQAGYFSIFTRPSSGTLTERLRITSAGQMVMGASTSKAKFEIKDNGYTSTSVLQRISADDANPYALIVANDTLNTNSNSGLQFFVSDQGIHYIRARGSSTASNNDLLLASQNNIYFNSGSSESERLRITSGGDVGVNGGSDVERKVDIVTSNGNSVLIRPNTGGDNARGNANVVNNSLIFRMPYGENAGSSSNAGARIGIVFTGRNDGSGYVDNPSKSASVYGISEDDSAGYTRKMGLGFFTSPFDAAQTEKMRISANGYVTTPSQPAFAARLGTNTDITSNTGNDLVFSVQEFDNSSSYNTSNGRFTAPVAGKYYFGVQIYAGFNGTGVRVMHANFRVNGTSVAQTDMFGGASNHGGTHYHPTAVGHMFRNLNANDYVTFNLGGFSHTGGQAILYASTGNRFFGYLVG